MRIIFADAYARDSYNGTEQITGRYLVPVNPRNYAKQSLNTKTAPKTLDGPNTYQFPHHNNDVNVFTWGKLPRQTEYLAMINALRGYRGSKVWLKEGSATSNRGSLWKPIFVIDVEIIHPNAKETNSYYCSSIKLSFIVISQAQHDSGYLAENNYPYAGEGGREYEEIPDDEIGPPT